jgi:hypothetical protein
MVVEGSSRSPIDENQSSAIPGSKRTLNEAAGSSKKAEAAQRAKRVRVSRACDQCRAGREKCDGGQPACHTCESQHRVCSYNEQPKKRGTVAMITSAYARVRYAPADISQEYNQTIFARWS